MATSSSNASAVLLEVSSRDDQTISSLAVVSPRQEAEPGPPHDVSDSSTEPSGGEVVQGVAEQPTPGVEPSRPLDTGSSVQSGTTQFTFSALPQAGHRQAPTLT